MKGTHPVIKTAIYMELVKLFVHRTPTHLIICVNFGAVDHMSLPYLMRRNGDKLFLTLIKLGPKKCNLSIVSIEYPQALSIPTHRVIMLRCR